MQTQAELRLGTLLDEREANHKLHETVIQAVGNNESKMPSESQAEQIEMYRETAERLDTEIDELSKDVEAHRKAVEASRNDPPRAGRRRGRRRRSTTTGSSTRLRHVRP